MEKNIPIWLVVLLFMPFFAFSARAAAPVITAETAVLIDASTGQVLYDKGMNKKMYPASTTKIMTGILAVESSLPHETATVTKSAVNIGVPGSSNIALTDGEELTIDELMYALMLPSANDAANVLAEHIGGTQEAFAEIMTNKARTLGAVNTNFANAHGLHDDNHYTTAYDMALITRYAAANKTFARYFGTELHTMPSTNKQPLERPFTNYDYMLVKASRYYHPDVIGGKVGFTDEARHTMSTIARRGGRTLICVVMGDTREGKFDDTKKLLEYGFTEFSTVTLDASQIPSFTVPVNDGGIHVGDAGFRAVNDASFLLHNSLDPRNITLLPEYPAFFEKGDTISAKITFVTVPSETTLSPVLGTISLPVTVSEVNESHALAEENKSDDSDSSHMLPAFLKKIFGRLKINRTVFLLLICGTLLILIAAVMLRIYTIQKRRSARLARIRRQNRSYMRSR